MTHSLGEGSVVRDWVTELTWKQQTVLLTAIRGCDDRPSNDPSKPIIQEYRSIILHNAVPEDDSTDGFMDEFTSKELTIFLDSIEEYPLHWITHFLHAAEIVGYKHPDASIRLRWSEIYNSVCEDVLSLNVETEAQLDERLEDG